MGAPEPVARAGAGAGVRLLARADARTLAIVGAGVQGAAHVRTLPLVRDFAEARGTELGEVLLGTRPGRRAADEVTVYKSMGHAVEDLAAAVLVEARARAAGVGQIVQL